jgi:E2/UBC family protein E/multiubiquitin
MSTSAKAHGVKIQINKTHYEAPSSDMTGAQLKALGSVPVGNKLFKESPGKDPDQLINDGDVVHLHNGDRFYDLPPGVVGDDTLLQRQLKRLTDTYPSAVVQQRPDGSTLLTVADLPLPPGWDRDRISISMILPAGYPTAKPSGFETASDLRLADGQIPAAGRGEHVIDGQPYAHFCWQPSQPWENDEHELWKRVKFALVRFAEHLT